MKRLQISHILRDLEKKMVFLSGPRQVGKTFLGRELAKNFSKSVYLNYDQPNHRQIIKDQAWHPSNELIIFDEIHKMPDWKNFLKGVYDTKPKDVKILVTGSARLETFRGSGDSLAGRYFLHRLLPITSIELEEGESSIDDFLELGEFPEPFLSKQKVEAKRWRNLYIDGLIREDILDFEKVHDFKKIQLTLDLLRRRVGGGVSYSNIAKDINASPNTVKRYIEIFEALFIIFRVTPYHRNIARSLLKEPKVYFYDTGMVIGDEGAKIENHTALALHKELLLKEDILGEQIQLHYLRTKDGKEVDFCRVCQDQVIDMIEVKTQDKKISKNLIYFIEKYGFQGKQLVYYLQEALFTQGCEIVPLEVFLKELWTRT